METKRKQTLKKTSSANKINARQAVTDFALNRKSKTLKDLKGRILFIEDYDYKTLRK